MDRLPDELLDRLGAFANRLRALTGTLRKEAVTRDNPGSWPYDELARQEWPHVPLQLARAYADEYVRTGQRP